MESFVVSARKYRPQDFGMVVGQAHVTDTLEKAIESGQLAQALLFCGPRGVGKTTCARILARKINEKDGSTSEDGFAYNIYELDAASNNSVDDIRNLIDQVRYAPQVGKYKVYIIDEVHMLSQSAFNAFLKTLEEPPEHTIFILATTEKHKIIPTILSRCQIYDFKRITVEDIEKHLMSVAGQEGVKFEKDALYLIAQKADGALRDALSIFDRISTFTQKNITLNKTTEILNVLDYEVYLSIAGYALECDIANILLALDQVIKRGFDVHLFIAGLGNHFRDLMMAQDMQTLSLIEVGENTRNKFFEQSKKWSPQDLVTAIEICNIADVHYKSSKNPRLTVEIALMQLASIHSQEGLLKKKKFSILAPFRKEDTEGKEKSRQQDLEKGKKERRDEEGVFPISGDKAEAVPRTEQNSSQRKYHKTSQPLLKRKPVFSSEFAIAEALEGKNEEEKDGKEVLEEQNLPAHHFSQSDVDLYWTEFLREVKKKNRIDHNAISRFRVVKKEEDTLLVLYPSESAKLQFEKYRESFFSRLKHKLNHYKIKIEFSADVHLKKEVLTKKKVFEKYVEINPLLKELDDLLLFDLS
ncbi:MAG: DNA polymerase III subunit gamma/tau [Bergeyella sp.]|nr:DNA polymerase III subunit gamma/tau [Bergeyella sp.]